MDDLLKIGIITSTHGIRGEVKVYPTTDDVKRFKALKECYIMTKQGPVAVEASGCKFFKQMVILKFKEIDSINDVEQYRQCDLCVTREHAVKLNKDEYFITDLIDATVKDETGKTLGKLTEVMQTGANDVYVVALDSGKEVLIPAIKQCILSVNLEQAEIVVHLLEGMLEE